MNEARKLTAPSLDATIGANVHTLMWRAQHTQTAIANELGMSQAALSLKLRGKRPWYADEIDHLARKYRVAHGDLFTKLPDDSEPHSTTVEYGRFAPDHIAAVTQLFAS